MNEKQLTIAIEGMHCGGCVTRVTGALRKLEGVRIEQVEVGSARVTVDADVPAESVVEAINRIGFVAREA